MKLFIRFLVRTNLAILLRNLLNFKPVYSKLHKKNYPTCVSDAFLWRTDNGYKTKFKYSDILGLFYKIKDSWVEIHFYSKNNELIKVEKINNLNLSNELEINREYLGNLEDYGSFYIYHFSKNKKLLNNKDIISNRCYLGYSLNNNLHSFIHGNTKVKFTSINSDKKIISSDIVKISFFKNQVYTIQKYFNDFDKNELAFINPTSKTIKFSLENNSFELKPHCALIKIIHDPIISIKSNCFFFRPTVFSYKGEHLDIHHS